MTGGHEGDEAAVPHSIRPGDVLAGRYRLVDLLTETGGGRFWRAHDRVLERHVALHVIDADDERAGLTLFGLDRLDLFDLDFDLLTRGFRLERFGAEVEAVVRIRYA